MLGGFGYGQSFAVQANGGAGTVTMPAAPVMVRREAAPRPLRRWQQVLGAPQHILVTLDGSGFAEQVLPVAESICTAFGARLTLVTVLPEQSRFRFPFRSELQPPGGNGSRRKVRAYHQGVARRMRAKGIDVTTVILTGPVAESVHQLMEDQAIDMSLISTRGRSGLQRWMLGSVASRLVDLARRPVLVIHPAPGGPPPVPDFGRILVALDGSEYAERVLSIVRASTKYGSVVTLLRVPEVPNPQRFGTMVEEIEELRAAAEARADRYLEDIAGILRQEGIETHVLVTGSRPAETIVSVAEAEDADIIILSTRGLGGVEGLLLGSVADRVVQDSHRPVLLVPIHLEEARENP